MHARISVPFDGSGDDYAFCWDCGFAPALENLDESATLQEEPAVRQVH